MGCKVLTEWSIEHSMMGEDEKVLAKLDLTKLWEGFFDSISKNLLFG